MLANPTRRLAPPFPRLARAGALWASLLVAFAAGAATAAAEGPEVDEALRAKVATAMAARTDAAASEEAVRVCAEAHEAAPDDLEIAASLVHARYYLAGWHRTDAAALAEHNRGLEVAVRTLARVTGHELDSMDAVDDHRDAIPQEAVGVLYWAALSYGRTIDDLPFFSQPGGARRFQRLVRRALELDETYFHGGPRRVLADFLAQAPGLVGGDVDEARVHARRAVELAPGFVENHLVLAEVIMEQDSDEDGYLRALERALEPPADGIPGCEPEQRYFLKKARTLLDYAKSRD